MAGTLSIEADLRGARTKLGRDGLIRAFRTIYLYRRIDDREILLKRQNKIFFQVSGAGHEAIQTAAGMVLKAIQAVEGKSRELTGEERASVIAFAGEEYYTNRP